MPLTASPAAQENLLALQQLDTSLNQLAYRAKSLPEIAELTSLGAEAERVRSRLVSENGAVEDKRAELARIESDVKIVETRIQRDVDRLQTSSSTKDVAGLESELESLRRRLGELEDIEIAVMEDLESLETVARETRESHDSLGAKMTEVQAARDAALETIGAERDQVTADRETMVAGLPDDLVALYERQRSRYGSGASLLQGGVSSASGVRLMENDLERIRNAPRDEVILCPDSQAILVRTNESGL